MLTMELADGWQPFEILTWDHPGVRSQPNGGARISGGSLNHGNVVIVRQVGSDSGALQIAVAKGRVITSGRILMFGPDKKCAVHEWMLENIMLCSYARLAEARESISMNYERFGQVR